MPKYTWMCVYKQDSEYALGANYAKIFNNVKFWIWQGSEYARVTQDGNMPEYIWNMHHTKHSARSLCKLMSTYWEIQNQVKDLRWSSSEK